MKGEAVLYSIAGVGLTLLLVLSTFWLGLLGAFSNMLSAVPVCYLVMRFGLPYGLLAVALSGAALWQLAGVVVLLNYLGLYALPSLLLPSLLRRGRDWDLALLISCLVSLAVGALLALGYIQLSGQSASVLIDRYLQSQVDMAMKIYRDAGFNVAQLADLKTFALQIVDFVRKTFVGLYAAGVLMIHLATMLLAQGLKGKAYRIEGVAFSQWRLPAMLIWPLIAAGFALLAPLDQVALVGRNLLAVLLPLYFVQGLAVVSCLLQRKPWPLMVKGLIYLMVFVLNPLPLVVTGVGVFDLWIDFRRPRIKD